MAFPPLACPEAETGLPKMAMPPVPLNSTTLPGNVVEFNGTGGIAIFGNPVSASGQANGGNAILGNSVFLNGRSYLSASSSPLPLLGIDLTTGFPFPRDDGNTPNDPKDVDAGPN